ncbi:kinase-like protein [Marasmius fiardii PR-910]|nr:kinase-like protein [Marasmius fiardii PR-910]
MRSDPWLNVAKQMAQTAAALAPVPGLKPGVDALCGLITLCEEVSANRNATRQLCNQCYRLLLEVEKCQPPPPSTLQNAFDDVARCIIDVQVRVQKWAKLSWARALVHLPEIQLAVDASKAEIAECFLRFQLASAADTSRWQTEFADVTRLDHEEVIVYLSSIQDGQEIVAELISNYGDKMLLEQEKTTNELKKVMAFMQENMGGLQSSSTDKYVAISKNLHDIQASTKTLLPNLHLVSGEITDIEEQAVSGTTSMDIFRGRYLQKEKVAIKVMRSVNADENTKRRFAREGRIWDSIYNIDRGKYILPFYGFGEGRDSRPFMVSPWQENGNALSYVRENDEKVNYKQMIRGIAEGLKVLHMLMQPPIVHGDIRAENIFINSEGNPLIGDFGLSKMMEDMTNTPFTQSNGVANLYRWFAPEIYIGSGSVSLSSDIYSFAMTVLELFTHQYPYSKIKHPPEVVLVVARKRPPPQPKEARVIERGLDDDMWKLLIECWDHIPSARPTIEEVLTRL